MGFDDSEAGNAIKTFFLSSQKESLNKETFFFNAFQNAGFLTSALLDFVVLVF